MNLEKKTVLITGANRGIGRALVDEALRRGAKRVFAGSGLQHTDKRVTPLTLDVTSVSQIQRTVDEVDILGRFGRRAAPALPRVMGDRTMRFGKVRSGRRKG
jgi:NAD(P)-dependent dehydrogenase (short-subunit alcohol dehydrogenase family)